jgi:hypothetical protein
MRFAAGFLVLLAFLSGSVPAAAQSPGKQPDKKEQPKGKRDSDSLMGCVDQEQSRYILINDRNRSPIANLEAEGFPTEGFAKYLGHKVTVRGTSSPGDGRPVFRVRSIDRISENCEPQALE